MSNQGQILVVDDIPANLKVLGETLRNAGYTVATAIDGERALNRLDHYQPDLILLDIQMPGIDGFETCRRLKANPKTKQIPVIFITALSDTASQISGFELGAVDYVTKPFNALELLARIQVHINLRKIQRQLIQESKLSTVGELVAGIAHEVNDPISFIHGNLKCAEQYFQELMQLVNLYEQHYPEPPEPIQDWQDQIDLPFLKQDYPDLVSSMKIGAERIKSMILSLNAFSALDVAEWKSCDLHEGLDNALLLVSSRLQAKVNRPAIQVIKNYGELPFIHCYPEQLNQAFANLLMNALDALDEKYRDNAPDAQKNEQEMPNLVLSTRIEKNTSEKRISLEITDNGACLIPALETQQLENILMDQSINQGTGIRMAIAHQIITEKHGGAIAFTSELGQGTTFTIQLPLAGE